MKKEIRKLVIKYGSTLAALALAVTTANVNKACFWIANQPELPEGAKTLRKF